MLTLFESITRVVVEELDNSGELIAVRSFMDADKFHCFCLVKKRRRFFGNQYDKTNLTLKDILESEVPFDMVVPEFQGQDGNFEILDVEDSKENWTVKFSPEMTFKIAFHIFHEMNIKLKKCEIPYKFLDSLRNKKLKKDLPSSFRSIQAKREDLYLVTETNEEEVTITPEKVLAYWVKQLVFPSAEKMIFVSLTKPDPFQKRKMAVHLGWVSEVQCSGELQMNNAANSLISSLFNAAGVLIEAETIWDILDALKELSEVRQFVAEALDKGTLPLMEDKVEPVLEENWGEGPLDVSCDPEARTACALYVDVSILLQLVYLCSSFRGDEEASETEGGNQEVPQKHLSDA
ncbi:unnamed protein product [Rangifer tarandus platyrhynchus]|uniref:Gasdermin pore forming domain-containing protein n=1 Tax=Rangifer tarandus platyrhynchus TaxID=3082113 RepID=A0ABN8YPD4_RANTA|nr:unnamed protein product [Rangifer tarandus platyrhynchus]